MTIRLKRTDPGAAILPGPDKQKRKWKNRMDTPPLQVSREAPGVHGTASEASSRSSVDAAEASQKMSRILKSMPLTSEKARNTSEAISKKKFKEPKETPEDTSRRDESSGKFITNQTPEAGVQCSRISSKKKPRICAESSAGGGLSKFWSRRTLASLWLLSTFSTRDTLSPSTSRLQNPQDSTPTMFQLIRSY